MHADPHTILYIIAPSKGDFYINLLGHHHLDELLIIDLSVSIDISLANHLIDLFVGELLAKIGHHMPQLRSTNESVAIAIENLESFNQLLFCIGVLHLASHQRKELWEI